MDYTNVHSTNELSNIKNVRLSEDASKNDCKVCFHCGTKVNSDDVFCSNSGAKKKPIKKIWLPVVQKVVFEY